jgi:citrate lyase subunit beta/citryl-CoA lyase
VIVDLEDGVAAARKDEARASAAEQLREPRDKPVFVRVNAHDDEDLGAVGGLPLAGVVVPKVERPEDIPEVELPVQALIESALGVENAFAIASHPGVRGISLGEADLRSQTGALDADWPRARVVNAAVAAGLPRPPQSVYMHVRDLDGLAVSCRRGRELGHLGRAAIHPDQLAVIERAYLPTEAEVETARATVETLETTGTGIVGERTFVDAAMLGAARDVLALADAYGTVS